MAKRTKNNNWQEDKVSGDVHRKSRKADALSKNSNANPGHVKTQTSSPTLSDDMSSVNAKADRLMGKRKK